VTLSIVARAADAHMLGMAIASSSPAVAARCAHARAGVGVVATQNITDPSLGPRVLDALAQGVSASTALEDVLATTRFAAYRQLLVLGREGAPVVHSGAQALGIVASAVSRHAAAAGNLLARAEVAAAMIAAFEAASGHLGARLLQALHAGAASGGEAGPLHSAGLLIVRDVAWPIVDLRVDWTDADPVAALSAVWDIYAPQIDEYVQRALDPAHAPAFGVAGNV
jgi:uncharacterized Ntn-hydrolase superfamily protein